MHDIVLTPALNGSVGPVLAEHDGHEDARCSVRILGPSLNPRSALAVRPVNLRPVGGPVERQERSCRTTDTEATDRADKGTTVRYRLAERVTVNMTVSRSARVDGTPNAGSDSDSESVATLLDQSGETVSAEPAQGGIQTSSRVSENFASTPGASVHAEDHDTLQATRKRLQSVIANEVGEHDGDASGSEADDGDEDHRSIGRFSIIVVDGELQSAHNARCAAFANLLLTTTVVKIGFPF